MNGKVGWIDWPGKAVERYWKGTFTAAAFINNMKRMYV
jgi:hypothetical protein